MSNIEGRPSTPLNLILASFKLTTRALYSVMNAVWQQLLDNDAHLDARVRAVETALQSGASPDSGSSTGSADVQANFTASNSGLSVTFSATASSTAGPVALTWTFGDGSSATGQNAVHTYAAAGTYTVTLNALDSADNQRTVTKTVLVTAASSGAIVINPFYVNQFRAAFMPSVYNSAELSGPLTYTARFHFRPELNLPPASVSGVLDTMLGGVSPTKNGSGQGYTINLNADMAALPSAAHSTETSPGSGIYYVWLRKVNITLTDAEGRTGYMERAWAAGTPEWFVYSNPGYQPPEPDTSPQYALTLSEAAGTVNSANKTFSGTYKVNAWSSGNDPGQNYRWRFIDFGDGVIYEEPYPDSNTNVPTPVTYSHAYAQTAAAQQFTVRFGYKLGSSITIQVTVPGTGAGGTSTNPDPDPTPDPTPPPTTSTANAGSLAGQLFVTTDSELSGQINESDSLAVTRPQAAVNVQSVKVTGTAISGGNLTSTAQVIAVINGADVPLGTIGGDVSVEQPFSLTLPSVPSGDWTLRVQHTISDSSTMGSSMYSSVAYTASVEYLYVPAQY